MYDQEYLEAEFTKQYGDLKLWGRLIQFILPQWKWVALAVGLAFGITAASLALPRLVQIAMDDYILNTSLSAEERAAGISSIAVYFLAVILAGFVANFLQVVVLEWTGQNIMHSLRQHLFRHVLRLNLPFFHAHPAGRLVTRHTNDIQNMYEMFTSVIITLFNEGVRIVGILVILFWMNWRLSLLLTLTFPVMLLITSWFGRLSRNAFRQIRTHLAAINAFLQEAVSGVAIIQLFLRQRDIHNRFAGLNDGYFRAALYQIRVFGVFVPLIEVMASVALALIIWYGGGQVLRNYMTIGMLTAFISYMRLFFQPIRELSQKYTIVQSAMTSAERIFQVLETEDFTDAGAEPLRIARVRGGIAFENVTFGYDPDRPVLKNLSFSAAPGETVAIVGATGAGKTTVISLLERFYDPQQGGITLDGADVRRLDPKWLREQIGLVMQDVFIVPGTVRENVLLDRELDEAEVERIIGLSQLSRLVAGLPQGLDTRVGEGGMDLSAGQRQLLALARVLARDPKILVLDEATANVDTETEMLVEQAIQAVLSNRTSIVIAHRLSTVRRADRILVMDAGRIVEQGTHESLMAHPGLYYHLQTLQNGVPAHAAK
jgi:ATP-binding cassette, subfamily B, multidrug efflux pump